jgi:hypothetical protein
MFSDRLAITLSLTIDGTAHPIAGGDVKSFALDLDSHGFTGSAEFMVASDAAHGGGESDALLTAFLGPSLVEVSLSVKAVWASAETSPSIQPLSVTGLVREKSLVETRTVQMEDQPVLHRRYRIAFADPAAVLWSQHFPSVLYTQKSPEDVIDAHKGEKIAVTYDSTTLGTPAPLFFVHLEPEDGASFYDFVLWYTDARAYVFAYDYAAKGYQIRDAKDTSGTVESLFGDDIAETTLVFPPVQRASAAVLSSYTVSPQNKPIAQAQAVTGIRKDFLMRSPIAQEVDDRVTLETKRLVVRKSELSVVFGRMPTITFQPGTLVKLSAGNRWSQESSVLTPTWRARSYHLAGRTADARIDKDHTDASTTFELTVEARLEQQDDPFVALPPFVRPTYPGLVEGKVVSEQGQEADITYQIYTDAGTSLETYKVSVPLWDDQQVTAPFAPHLGQGNVYLPAYKNERVLLAIGLLKAHIVELCDWRQGARLGMDVQGEQILFGKSGTSHTSVNHVYDGDSPVLNVARIHDKDTATLQIKEGSLIITVKEDS